MRTATADVIRRCKYKQKKKKLRGNIYKPKNEHKKSDRKILKEKGKAAF